jgi:hypothetical protein
MAEFVKIRTGGEYFDVLKDDKVIGNIIVGNVLQYKVIRKKEEKIVDEVLPNDQLIDRFPHPEKIKVYRGGKTKTVSESEYKALPLSQRGEIEYHYTKNEIVYENGVARLKSDAELLEDAKENIIKLKAVELNNDPVKMVNGEAKVELESYNATVDKIKTIEELKNI